MVLITGGVKSGKSSLALTLARQQPAPRVFIATGVAMDDEFKQRIEIHRRERGADFILHEEPTEIMRPLEHVKAGVYVIDCITLWVNNLLYYKHNTDEYCGKLITALTGREIIVTNEVGWGVIPDNALSRQYIDTLGAVNKALAQHADTVYLMASGIPMRIK